MEINLFIASWGRCKICRQEVFPNNNAVIWGVAYKAILNGIDPVEALHRFVEHETHLIKISPRHLLPINSCNGHEDTFKMVKGEKERMTQREKRAAKKAYQLLQRINEEDSNKRIFLY